MFVSPLVSTYSRNTDPPTSAEPERRYMRSWKTQSGRALIVHYFHHRYGIKPEGLNHWECEKLVIQSGWSLGECGWHRIGDLHNVKMGWDYIELLRDASGQVVTRPGKHGDLREVF